MEKMKKMVLGAVVAALGLTAFGEEFVANGGFETDAWISPSSGPLGYMREGYSSVGSWKCIEGEVGLCKKGSWAIAAGVANMSGSYAMFVQASKDNHSSTVRQTVARYYPAGTYGFSYKLQRRDYGDEPTINFQLYPASSSQSVITLSTRAATEDMRNKFVTISGTFTISPEQAGSYYPQFHSYETSGDHTAVVDDVSIVMLWDFTVTEITDEYRPTQIVNGDFSTEPWMDYTYNGRRYTQCPNVSGEYEVGNIAFHGVDEGWNTTETKTYDSSLFEYTCRESGTHSVLHNPSISRLDKYIEMNCQNPAILYQDLSTHEGDVVRWSLKHAVRTGDTPDQTQSMRVEIGSPLRDSGGAIVNASGTWSSIDSKISSNGKALFRSSGVTDAQGAVSAIGFAGSDIANLSLDKTNNANGWRTASGVYIVPDGQTVTRFGFVSEAKNVPNWGNLLDDVVFSTLIGNLRLADNGDGSATITGYWGDDNPEKRLAIEIGEKTYYAGMGNVLNKNFSFVISADQIGNAREVTVYHEDYPSAAKTITFSGTPVFFDAQGGAGGTASVEAASGAPMPTITPPTRALHKFLGYFDADGKRYYDDLGRSTADWDKEGSATLTAKWEERPDYSLAYLETGVGGQTDVDIHNVSWNAAENAAYFSGSSSYLNLLGKPLAALGVTIETGFTIDFQAKADSTEADWARFLDVNDGTTASATNGKYFFINAGNHASPYPDRLGILEICYTVNGNGTGREVTDALNCHSEIDKYSVYDQWRNFRLVVAPGGYTTLYMDGRPVCWIKENNTLVNVLKSVGDLTTYLVGASAYGPNDGYMKGYMRNLVFTGVSQGGVWNGEETLYKLAYETGCEVKIPTVSCAALPSPLPVPVRAGYRFDGWFTDSERTVPAVAGAALTCDTTLYAQWKANSYKYILDGGSFTGEVAVVYGALPKKLDRPPVAEGKTFLGYFDEEGHMIYNAEGEYVFGAPYAVAGDTKLSAVWTEKPETIELVAAKQRWPWNGKVDVAYAADALKPERSYVVNVELTVTEPGASDPVKRSVRVAIPSENGERTLVADFDGVIAAETVDANATVTLRLLLDE